MAYSELIKNFGRIREYMREFFVYGFKSREDYTQKSARSYDDERRRLESWLGDHMQFRQTPDGKNLFLSIDSRIVHHNPLFRAWKAKSFTDGDITLHFILFDILDTPEKALSLKQITAEIDGYLQTFSEPRTFDESTVRKKLKEYAEEGIVVTEKRGRTVLYRRTENGPECAPEILDFFSEVLPCGVVGSYLLDKTGAHDEHFAFKHHYITGAMDSGIVCALLEAMREKRFVTVETLNRRNERITENRAVPLRIMISAQSGRQYVMVYLPRSGRITAFRTDNILSVEAGEPCEKFDEYREILDGIKDHIWGVSTQSMSGDRMEHVEFTVRYAPHETYIHQRMEREKRCGTVERLDGRTSRFSADVYNVSEMIPWIRTFLSRITEIRFSDPALEEQFRTDLAKMYEMYGLDGEVET